MAECLTLCLVILLFSEEAVEQPETKRRREENGLPSQVIVPRHEEQAPLFVECMKQELPDVPFMECVPDIEEGQREDGMLRQTEEYSENDNEQSSQRQSQHSEPSVALAQKNKVAKASRKRKTITTEVCLQDPEDDADTGNPTEIVIAEDVSFIETKE